MIKRFRSLSETNLVLLIFVAIFFRVFIFIENANRLDFDFGNPFVKSLVSAELSQSLLAEVNVAISLVLMFIQALLINRVVNAYSIIGKPTFLPALLFITFSSLFPQFAILSPMLLCNFLLIWIIYRLLSIYQSNGVRFIMFDVGMIIGVGTLIYLPFVTILPIVWISLIIFRPFVWREWLLGIVGFITVFLTLALYYFWNDSLSQFYKTWLPLSMNLNANLNIDIYDYWVLLPVIIILLLAIFQLQQNFFRKSIQIRKAFQIFFFLFLLTLISFYIETSFSIYNLLLCVPSASIFAAYFFLNEKRSWLFEWLYLMLVGFIIVLQLS